MNNCHRNVIQGLLMNLYHRLSPNSCQYPSINYLESLVSFLGSGELSDSELLDESTFLVGSSRIINHSLKKLLIMFIKGCFL